MSESKKTKNLSLHLFFKTFFDGVKTQQESLLELQNTLLEFNIAEMTDAEGLIFENNDGKFNLKCVVSDKRSYNFINSIDDRSTNKRTDSDHIREYLFTVFCTDNFKIIVSIAEYFKKFCTFSSNSYAFIEEFKKTSFDNEENKRELVNFFEEKLESDSLRAAWTFVFLCFPKTPSEKNTDYRLMLLKKLLQSRQTKNDFQPLDITGNDKQIEKVNIDDIGRGTELEEIKKEMLANNTVLVYGIGGIGKSYICRKLFWNYYDSFSDGIEYLAWIQYNGDLIQSVISSFYDPETNLDNIRKKYENHPVVGDMFVKLAFTDKPDDKMQVIKEYFSKLDSKLLVFIDNADTMTKEEKKWLNSCKCRMIITSRQKIDGFHNVNINCPTPEYCKEMYVREIWENNKGTYSLKDEKYINKITELANYHTQTVMLIAKAQICLGLSSEEMLEELNKTGFVLKGNDEIIDTEEYELTMAEHLTKIFNLLNVTDENQLRTIRLFSLLAPNTPIKKRNIKKWFELSNLSSINELVKYGWLNSLGSEYVSIHPVISNVVRYNNKLEFELAFSLLNALQEEMYSANDYVKRTSIVVHCVSAANYYEDVKNEGYATLLCGIASIYYDLNNYNTALNYHQKALKIRREILGEENIDTGTSYNDIAAIYTELSNYNEALKYLKKAFIIYEKNYGLEHYEIASIYNNYGVILCNQGLFEESLNYHNKALAIRERVLERENIDTATTYCNIGVVYATIGNYIKALDYYNKALAIREKLLGFEHDAVADSYSNIGVVYDNLEDYDKALDYHNKALEIRKKILGIEHSDVASSYFNIGAVYGDLGDYDKELDYYNKALEIRTKILGTEHIETAHSYSNIAVMYCKLKRYVEALEFHNKALAILEKVLGREHIDTALCYSNIGAVYYNLEDYDKTLEYYSKAMVIQEKILGSEHPNTTTSYFKVGEAYCLKGEYNKALEYYNKILEFKESVLGSDPNNIASFYNNIGTIYSELDNYNKALEYYNMAISTLENTSVTEAIDTIVPYNNISLVFEKQEKYDKALEYLTKVLLIQKNILGDSHPNTIDTQNYIKKIENLISENQL